MEIKNPFGSNANDFDGRLVREGLSYSLQLLFILCVWQTPGVRRRSKRLPWEAPTGCFRLLPVSVKSSWSQVISLTDAMGRKIFQGVCKHGCSIAGV